MSSPTNRNVTKSLLLLGALVLVGAVAAYFLWSRPSGPPAAASKLASLLPAKTPLLVWTTDIESLLELGRDAGFDGAVLAEQHARFGDAVKKMGANPLTVEGLGSLGIDTTGSVGLALSPAKEAEMIFALYLPMVPGQPLAKRLMEIFQKLEVAEHVTVEEASPEGKPIAWLHPIKDGQMGPGIAALLEVDGGALVLFPANDSRAKAEDVSKEISAYAEGLIAGDSETLDSVPAYGDAVATTGGALLAAFFNPDDSTRTLNLGDESMQMLFWVMASTQGAAFSLVEDGSALRLQSYTVLESADVAAGAPRDLAVLDLIPGHPVAGLHVAIDLKKALAELEKTLPTKEFNSHSLVKFTTRGSLPGLDEGTSLMELLSGELGIFLADMGDSSEATVAHVVGFIGVKDKVTEGLVKGLLDDILGARDVAVAEVLGTTIYRLSFFPGSPSLMLKDGRLWFAGTNETLVSVAKGEKGSLTDGDRNSRIAAVMREEGSVGLFVDIDRVVARLLPLLGASIEGMGPAGRFLATLDYLTLGARVDGAAVHSEFALHAKGESFRKTALAALLATVDGSFGAVRERKVETVRAHKSARMEAARGEAEHNLHDIYGGAANYFETPNYSSSGEPLACQFPPSQATTPGLDCCGDGSGLCPGQSEPWDSSSTWAALSFSINRPHYCVYSFESSGTGADAQFTATARCDADCDGRATVHKMTGKAGPASTQTFCDMAGERTKEVFEE